MQAGARPRRDEERMESEGMQQGVASRSLVPREGEGGGGGSGVRCWNRHPAPCSSPPVLLSTIRKQMAVVRIVKKSY